MVSSCFSPRWNYDKSQILFLIKSFVDPKSNFFLFPKWSHNFSLREFPQTNPFFKKCLLGCASCCQTSNQRGKLNQIGCKIKKERHKEQGMGGGGVTMCHNILLPSKVPKEWRNIPISAVYAQNIMML